jgi:hypothetical protein
MLRDLRVKSPLLHCQSFTSIRLPLLSLDMTVLLFKFGLVVRRTTRKAGVYLVSEVGFELTISWSQTRRFKPD